MHKQIKQVWCQEEGVLSFEWVLLLTLLTIGVVSGIAGARDAIIDELADIAEATISIDQSYSLATYTTDCATAVGFSFTDDAGVIVDCARTSSPSGQGGLDDSTDGA